MLLLTYIQSGAQFRYKLDDYRSKITVSQSLNKSIQVNDIVVDDIWFFDYHLTNTKVYSQNELFWTAISEEDIETFSGIIRTNVFESNRFNNADNNTTNPDYELNTYLLFWNSSLCGGLVYTGLCMLAEIENQDNLVVWNKKYFCENESMSLKRKIVLQEFIDKLITDLTSLELDDPEFRQINNNQDRDTTILVVFQTNSLSNSKKSRKTAEKLTDPEQLSGLWELKHIDSYFLFFFNGHKLTRVDNFFYEDNDPKTTGNYYYRERYLDGQHRLTTVIDNWPGTRYDRLKYLNIEYGPESIEKRIEELTRRESELEEAENKISRSGSNGMLQKIQEEKKAIMKLKRLLEEGTLTDEIVELSKEQWFIQFEYEMKVFELENYKVFKCFE